MLHAPCFPSASLAFYAMLFKTALWVHLNRLPLSSTHMASSTPSSGIFQIFLNILRRTGDVPYLAHG